MLAHPLSLCVTVVNRKHTVQDIHFKFSVVLRAVLLAVKTEHQKNRAVTGQTFLWLFFAMIDDFYLQFQFYVFMFNVFTVPDTL